MNKHKPFNRLLAMVLAIVMVLGMTPTAAAAEIQPEESSGEIIAFEALSEETANKEVPLGTSQEDLALPDILNATVRVATPTDAEKPEQDSGEPQFEDKGISVQVQWVSEPDYDSDTADTYTFTAGVPDDSYTVSAALPAITVTVQEEAPPTGSEITAFAVLSDGIAEQAVPIGTQRSVLALPETLAATVHGEEVQVPVTWESTPEYAPGGEDEEPGEYIFTPRLSAEYTLAEGASLPQITVATTAPLALRGAKAALTDWGNVQTAITSADEGAVIDLSGFSTPEGDAVYTFNVGSNKTLTLKGNGTQIANVAFAFGANNNITIENLNIKSAHDHADSSDTSKKGYSPLHFTGTENTLTLVGTNTVTSGQTSGVDQYGAAVGVPESANLTICAAENNPTASLVAQSAVDNVNNGLGAGIGGGFNTKGGSITIESGSIKATGGGAGIGGGFGSDGGPVTINGGIVEAVGNSGAGIGGGWGLDEGGDGGTVTITGGTVTVQGARSCAGIGGGGSYEPNPGNGGNVTIAGGSVNVKAGADADRIGGGYGGGVYTPGGPKKGTSSAPTNGAGSTVYYNTWTLSGTSKAKTSLTSASIGDKDCNNTPNAAEGIYGIRDVRTDSSKMLYFWLPASSNAETITLILADGNEYRASFSRPTKDQSKTFSESSMGRWNTLKENIKNGATVAELSGYSSPEEPFIITVPQNQSLQIKGTGAKISNLAFVFEGKNNVTIEKINIASAHNHKDEEGTAADAPLYFAGGSNTITLLGSNTVASGQHEDSSNYGSAIKVAASANLTISSGGEASALSATGTYKSSIAGGCITLAGGNITAASSTLVDYDISGDVIIIGGSVNAKIETPENGSGAAVYLNKLSIPGQNNTIVSAGKIGENSCSTDQNPPAGAYGIKGVTTNAQGEVWFWLPESAAEEEVRLTIGGSQYGAVYQRDTSVIEKTLVDVSLSAWDALQESLNEDTDPTLDLSEIASPAAPYILSVPEGKTVTFTGDSGRTINNLAIIFEGNNNVTIQNLNIQSASNHKSNGISGYAPLCFKDAENTLLIRGANTVKSGQPGYSMGYGAGINVLRNAKLTIRTDEGGATASLTAIGNYGGAGIGGGYVQTNLGAPDETLTAIGSITIDGGSITASGGYGGAGIGCGREGEIEGTITFNHGTIIAKGGADGAGIGGGHGADGKNIAINGGTVSAIGGSSGAGIGGGDRANGQNITINGGTVSAIGGDRGAGIGGGASETGGWAGCGQNITINGGTVTAQGNLGAAGIGSGINEQDTLGGGSKNFTFNGGSIKANALSAQPKKNSQPVYLNTLTLGNHSNAHVTAGSIGSQACIVGEPTAVGYGIKDVMIDSDSKLYFYLPASESEELVTATVDGIDYIAQYTRAANHDNTANMGLSLLNAEIAITGSLQYTGSALEPAITVTLGAATLEKDTDYTVGYEGDRTAAGDSGKVIITGTGNYAGKAEKVFTVAKKAITVTPGSGQSKKYGEGDPILTYTPNTLQGSDQFTGALSRASGDTVGTYLINLGTLSAGDNYILSLAAEPVYFTIEKCEVAAPAAPTLARKTHNSITLEEISGAEYRKGTDGAWQESNLFEGLSPNTEYIFYARYAATDTQNESSASAASESITTDKAPQTAPPAPELDGGITATAATVKAPSGVSGDVQFACALGSNVPGDGDWQGSGVFTGLNPNTEYSFYLRLAETVTSEASPASPALTVTTVKATLTGSVSIVGTLKYGENLTANTTNMVTNVTDYVDFGTLSYQWQRHGSDISGATGSSYTLVEEDIGSTISVVVSSDNCTGSVTSSATSAVEKADGPAAPSSVNGSYAGDGTNFTYTVTSISGAEYKMDDGQWKDSNVFAGIVPESAHTFYARMKETETHNEGASGNTGVVTFAKLNDRLAPALAYTISGSFPKTVTITAVDGAEYKFGDAAWSDTNTYTSNQPESITLSIRLKATETHNASVESSVEINTANQNQTAPAAFTLTYAHVNETSYTVTIPTTAGAEYSFDGENWSGVNTKSGLQPGAMVTGYKRMAAKEGFNTSPVVSASVTLPLFRVKTPAVSPNGGTFTGSQNVSLSSATADAKIYYTTDGTTPTIGSTLYTTAINLTATTTLKVIAVKDGMTDSALLTVTFTKQSGSGGGSSSGGSSGGSSSGSSTTTTTTTPGKTPNQPVTAAAPVTATAGQNGLASASIPEKAVTDAIAKAQADAKAQGKTANGIGVSVNVTVPANTKSLSLVLTQPVLKQLTDAKVQQFEVNGQILTMNLNQQTIQQLRAQSDSDVTVTVKSATVKGVRNAYDISFTTVKNGKTVVISSMGSGSVTLSIPYTPAKGEAVGYLYAVHVDAKGKLNRIPGSAYDTNSRSTIFSTNHFSVYGVGYEVPSAKFSDIGSHWAKESIDYVIGRGLFGGNAEGKFKPDTSITRGDFVTALGRLSGVDTKAYTKSSFTDVKAGSYYLPYIEWAYGKSIIQGIGNSQFAPERAITRQEIAVILQNYAKATGYKLPVTRNATTFADASSIGNAYQTAVTAMQQAGIMMGEQNNRFNPIGNTTRAEASAMLHRYIKLTIDPDTAQGWAKNDDGQYMYYKSGKPLTGTQTIDGVKYYFNDNGTLKTGWIKDDAGNWHFYSGNILLVGWWDIGANGNNKRYYFNKDGIMVAGKWLQIDGKWYYFYADGSLARSVKIDEYEVDENGVRKTK